MRRLASDMPHSRSIRATICHLPMDKMVRRELISFVNIFMHSHTYTHTHTQRDSIKSLMPTKLTHQHINNFMYNRDDKALSLTYHQQQQQSTLPPPPLPAPFAQHPSLSIYTSVRALKVKASLKLKLNVNTAKHPVAHSAHALTHLCPTNKLLVALSISHYAIATEAIFTFVLVLINCSHTLIHTYTHLFTTVYSKHSHL